MRRLYWFGTLLALLVLVSCGSPSKAFVWQNLNTDVQVRADGNLAVTETLTLRYTGGPFTFAFRDLPNRRLDRISAITVSDGEHTFRQVDNRESAEPYTFSVFTENGGQRLRWVYPPISNSSQTFTLRYEVAGAVRRYDDADEVWWAMVFGQREEVVEHATGRIELPAAVPPSQLDASTPDDAIAITPAAGVAVLAADNVPPNRELTLRLRFPKGVVGGTAPAWQAEAQLQDQYDATTRPSVNVALSALAAGLIVLFGVLIAFWRRRNADPGARDFIGDELPTPPDDLPPALAARLVGASGGQALIGTVIDLANRGYLTIHEMMGGWRGKVRQYVLRRADQPVSGLAPFESAALDALFAGQAELVLGGRNTTIAKAASMLDQRAQAALIERGLLSTAGVARRRRGIVIGVVVMAVGIALLIPAFVLAERYSWWLPVVAGVVGLAGVTWIIVAGTVRGLSEDGAGARVRWQAFQRYLKRINPDAAPSGQFDRLLPYAMAIGDAGRFTGAYSTSSEALPIWYYPIMVGGGPGGGVHGSMLLQDFSQNFVAAMTSATSSTGGGAGGAGGASGGGGGGAG